MTTNRLRMPDLRHLRRLQDLPYLQRLQHPQVPYRQRLQDVSQRLQHPEVPYRQRLQDVSQRLQHPEVPYRQRLQDVPQRLQRLSRRHRIAAVGAFTIVGVLVGPTAAMASPGFGSNPPVVTEQTASSAAAAMVGSLAQSAAADQPASSSTPAPVDSSVAAAPAVPAPPAPPTDDQLHPLVVTAAQQTFTPSAAQLSNARAIVDAGKALGLPPRAWVIAVATSLQESNLLNLGDLGSANDHDSLGLFQQRPSSGWGTAAQVQDPTYAATAFYQALVNVPGWDTLPLSAAAQTVQVSAFPSAYAKHEMQAGYIIDAFYGVGPYAALAAGLQY